MILRSSCETDSGRCVREVLITEIQERDQPRLFREGRQGRTNRNPESSGEGFDVSLAFGLSRLWIQACGLRTLDSGLGRTV